MIEDFKKWVLEIQDEALQEKRNKAIKKGDESKWKSEIWMSPKKNEAIKRRFRDEGAKRGFRSRPSYKTNAGEWLYDFVWREFDENDNLLRIELAMEIEVSDMHLKGIRYDFNKLLQSDAKFKIHIFQLKTEDDVKSALDSLFQAAKKYAFKSESEFLLCGWSTALNQFLFKEFKVGANCHI